MATALNRIPYFPSTANRAGGWTNGIRKLGKMAVTTTPNQITWADIPQEIIGRILQHCDRRSLLALSQLNHQLNSFALSRYFAPQVTRTLIELPSNFHLGHAGETPPLRILRTALSLPRTIQHIDYNLPPHINCDLYFNDLHDLTAFISRMPNLISLRIDSNFVVGGRAVDEQSRHKIWNELLVAAILKGCKDLEVRELGAIRYERPSPALSEDLEIFDLLLEPRFCCIPRLTSIPNPMIAPQGLCSFLSPGRWFPRRMKSTLQEVRLNGINLRNSPLMFHAILTWHAASITQLFLRNLIIWEPGELKGTFDSLYFPVLESFVFSNSRLISPITFLKFLSRHCTTLTLLDLEADFRQNSADEIFPVPKWSFWRRPPTFPNLHELRMFPGALAWLIPGFHRCPNLRFIAFLRNTSASTPKSRNTIKSILSNLHALPPSVAWPLRVEIAVPLGDRVALLDLWTDIEGTTLARWPRVKQLKLLNTSRSPPQFGALADWLSTFPSLEYLEFEATPHLFKEWFVHSVATLCPRLRSLRHPHGRLGREWKVWDVQDGRVSSHITAVGTVPAFGS